MFTKDVDTPKTVSNTPNAINMDEASVPFHERLKARKGERPQSTLGIVAGIDNDAEAQRARRQNRGVYAATAADTGALGSGGFDESHSLSRTGGGGNGGAGGASDDEGGSRLGDISQFAFAGLAVLGLAGLSVLAAESALKGPDDPKTPGTDPEGTAGAATVVAAGAPQTETSSAALTTAATDVAVTPWFDYRGAADMLAKRQAEIEAAKLAAERAEAEATAQAGANATVAIAEAEAKRLADEAALAASANNSAEAEAAAEKARLAEIEAARVAEIEAAKLAKQQAEAKSLADAETKRLAELEAQRVAAAETEAKRLAQIEADKKAAAAAEAKRVAQADAAAKAEAEKLAKLEADREAKAEAVRVAKAKADREAKAEAVRLAKLESDRKAEAAAVRLAKVNAEKAAKAKATKEAAARTQAAPRTTQRPIVFAAYTGAMPQPASLKPAKPRVVLASSTPTRVTRTAPPTYSNNSVSVRPMTRSQPVRRSASTQTNKQTVDDFLASRVQRTAGATVRSSELVAFKAQFLDMVENESDGARRTLSTPDGREVNVYFESTTPIEAVTKTIRTIDYSTVSGADATRFAGNVRPVKVSVMCRDVSYAFPGQERGRFAACQRDDGGWMLARASDPGARPT